MNTPFDNYSEMSYLSGSISECVNTLTECFRSGGRVLVCGNGGSGSDCEHIAGELLKGFLKKRPVSGDFAAKLSELGGEELAGRLQQGLPCISLVSHTALISAVVNDLGGDLMFAQQVMALGRKGDILIGISTSGNAKNVAAAAVTAKAAGMTVIGMTGRGGGRLGGLSDILLNVPAEETYRIQEYHIALYHYFCGAVEENIFPE